MSGPTRQRRSVPRKGRRARLVERDHWILESLTKMRFLTTRQLASLFFGSSRWAANKRLRKLLDAGLVRVWVRDLARDNIYSLTRAGASVHEERADDDVAPIVPRGLDGNLDHLLAINQVRIALAVSLPDAGGELTWWRSDWELRGLSRKGVVPDALFAVRWDKINEQFFALEIDNNTRSPRAFLKKVLRYASVRRQGRGMFGVTDFLILVVGRNPEVIERYRLAVAALDPGRIWFSTLEALGTDGASGPIWKVAGQEGTYSLPESLSLPCRKEGTNGEASTIAGSSGISSARV